MQDLKYSKFFTCGALIFSIHIFRFKTDAGFQVDTDFNTESKFFFQGPVSFHPQVGTQNNQTHETAFFFIYLVGLEGSQTIQSVKPEHFV